MSFERSGKFSLKVLLFAPWELERFLLLLCFGEKK